MHRLTVCMIAKNEEKVIGRAIRSALPVADEVIVVDTGSIDSTREIADSLGARVIEFPWCDDFSAARNAGIEIVKTPWCAWLDCDDEIAESSYASINYEKSGPEDNCFSWTLKNVGNCDWDIVKIREVRQIRMFPSCLRFSGRVHENIGIGDYCLDEIPVIESPAVVLHHGYTDAESVKKKLYRNARLRAIEAGMPKNLSGFVIGDCYFFYAPDTMLMLCEHMPARAVAVDSSKVIGKGAEGMRHLESVAIELAQGYITRADELTYLEDQITRLEKAINREINCSDVQMNI